jgi:hypothetical protein
MLNSNSASAMAGRPTSASSGWTSAGRPRPALICHAILMKCRMALANSMHASSRLASQRRLSSRARPGASHAVQPRRECRLAARRYVRSDRLPAPVRQFGQIREPGQLARDDPHRLVRVGPRHRPDPRSPRPSPDQLRLAQSHSGTRGAERMTWRTHESWVCRDRRTLDRIHH